ncbi:hypothetical protein BGX21_000364 [Mortierella sp. AD011]|nr:hypothetical protein BGX20_000256 [Mortierella sp. AD010]KAF9401854.1 hypothetical protein BGX21_000364 [Mortierella sp. AD011]
MLHNPDANVPANAPFLNTLKNTNALTEPVIGIWLKDTSSINSTTAPGGEITFGGVDSTRFVGDITYINCDPISPWTIPLTSFSVSGKTYLTTGALATIDTGTTAMLLPETVADAINIGIPGSIKMATPQEDISWIIPCNGTTSVSFTFGAFTATIPYSSIAMNNIKFQSQQTGAVYCASVAMYPVGRITPMKEWLLGDALLKNVYSVYDFGTNAATGGRIGFAQLVGSNSSSNAGNNSSSTDLGNGYAGSGANSSVESASSSIHSMSRVLQVLAAVAGIAVFTL